MPGHHLFILKLWFCHLDQKSNWSTLQNILKLTKLSSTMSALKVGKSSSNWSIQNKKQIKEVLAYLFQKVDKWLEISGKLASSIWCQNNFLPRNDLAILYWNALWFGWKFHLHLERNCHLFFLWFFSDHSYSLAISLAQFLLKFLPHKSPSTWKQRFPPLSAHEPDRP